MKKPAIFKNALIALLILLLAAPSGVMGLETGPGRAYSQEELSQMLAPIALYPDSLLANLLVASTFPLEVVAADRWVKQNKKYQLASDLDQMKWDLSVKALVPFPEVLSMMSEKLEWTQALGEAFLAQQADVMNTVQDLRAKAQGQGSLKTTSEQKVIVQEKAIVIEPANPTVVYVPSYNPAVVYGAWPYPAYPPYPYYPYGGVVAAGAIGFAAGIAVGAAWNHGWGNWDWHGGSMNVNVNRNVNINGNRVSNYNSQKWNSSARQNSVANRQQFRQTGASSADRRGDYRGRTDGRGQGASGRPGMSQGQRPSQQPARSAGQGLSKGQLPSQRPSAATRPASTRPAPSSVSKGLQQRQGGGAFQGVGSGGQARMNSDRGFSSRQSSPASFRSTGTSGASRGGYSGAGRGGGSFSGGGRSGGFSGGARGGGGGRGGGGRRR